MSNFSLIISCTPQGWETLYEENAALVRRLSANVVFLEPLNEKNSVSIVANYLDQYRADGFQFIHGLKNINKSEEEPNLQRIFPFTKEAISEIRSLAKGNISEVLKYCCIAIDMGISENLLVIDAEDVPNLIAKYMGQ